MLEWSIVYERAKREDGSLFFPERLTQEFLEEARRTMGSYLYANQYQNQIIPEEEKRFKKDWLRYTLELPRLVNSFGFIDPAIGQKDHHDYTAIVIVSVDQNKNWYIRLASRYRLTPTQIINKSFEICDQFQLSALGMESVAYQEALIYLATEKMIADNQFIPLKEIKRSRMTKESRILGLVPRFEFGRIYCVPGLVDLEDEFDTFPRGNHDDILDALASIEEIAYYPEIEKEKEFEQPNSPHHPNYERWIIQQYVKRANENGSRDGSLGESND